MIENSEAVTIDVLSEQLFVDKQISVAVLRLDKIDAVISGNKIFKLKYFIEEARASGRGIITFGGAYSNHLYATAAACNERKIPCAGIVRGEQNNNPSPTLLFCESQGMELKYISRSAYERKTETGFVKDNFPEYANHMIIPEGGSNALGVKGAGEIACYFKGAGYTHICCPAGSGTTLAGLITTCSSRQEIMGFNVVGKHHDLHKRIDLLLPKESQCNYSIVEDYHFGGFAKTTTLLLSFMNTLFLKHAIPTDIVYTGKMTYGVYDLIYKDYFKPGNKVLIIHTGGLQGNLSLPKGSLVF